MGNNHSFNQPILFTKIFRVTLQLYSILDERYKIKIIINIKTERIKNEFFRELKLYGYI